MKLTEKRVAQFWSRVDKTGECWLFDKVSTSTGYGVFYVGRTAVGAHRVAYTLSVGPIAPKKQVDHLCQNRACVNPEHLQSVSQAVNMARGAGISAQNAHKSHCDRGHVFDAENTHYAMNQNMARICLSCKRIRERQAYYQRVRELQEKGLYSGHNRHKLFCKQGHPFDEANTVYRTRKGGQVHRMCKICQANFRRKSRQKRSG